MEHLEEIHCRATPYRTTAQRHTNSKLHANVFSTKLVEQSDSVVFDVSTIMKLCAKILMVICDLHLPNTNYSSISRTRFIYVGRMDVCRVRRETMAWLHSSKISAEPKDPCKLNNQNANVRIARLRKCNNAILAYCQNGILQEFENDRVLKWKARRV